VTVSLGITSCVTRPEVFDKRGSPQGPTVDRDIPAHERRGRRDRVAIRHWEKFGAIKTIDVGGELGTVQIMAATNEHDRSGFAACAIGKRFPLFEPKGRSNAQARESDSLGHVIAAIRLQIVTSMFKL